MLNSHLRRFDGRSPPDHILYRLHALMPCAAGIHDFRRLYVTVDSFRDDTPVEGIARRLDLVFAAAARFGLGDAPPLGRSQTLVTATGDRKSAVSGTCVDLCGRRFTQTITYSRTYPQYY